MEAKSIFWLKTRLKGQLSTDKKKTEICKENALQDKNKMSLLNQDQF